MQHMGQGQKRRGPLGSPDSTLGPGGDTDPAAGCTMQVMPNIVLWTHRPREQTTCCTHTAYIQGHVHWPAHYLAALAEVMVAWNGLNANH